MVDAQNTRSSRRDFLKSSALVTGSFLVVGEGAAAGVAGLRRRPGEKLNIAAIGCGGKGVSDVRACAGENIVALCDVDWERAKKTFAAHEKARKYTDFREMLDREKDLDAVTISTPDHTHAVAAVAAMQRGLHVFCQKPLTHSVEEARVLRLLAQDQGVITQMGNQGTAHPKFREAVEVVRSGAIGTVRQVHVWTNRPVWPQGIARPDEIQAIPSTMRWDLWLGPAKHRPYNKCYAPFSWRGWWDFGTGAIGDMACHTLNLPYLALGLTAPTSVEADCPPCNDETPPKSSVIRYAFPARNGHPPVELTWYDGGQKIPADLLPEGVKVVNTGSLLVGDKGMLYSAGDYGTKYRLLPEKDFEGYEPPAPSLPRSPGIAAEWIAAIKGEGPKPMSSFDHAGPFTEAALLGNVAMRCGQRIEWDAANMRVTNCDAERFVRDEDSYGYSI